MSEPKNLIELCAYIARHADAIFVRRKVKGRWKNTALADLPARDALYFACGWIAAGRVPVRVRSEEEMRKATR